MSTSPATPSSHPADGLDGLGHDGLALAEQAIRDSRRIAHQTLDEMAARIDAARAAAGPAIDGLAHDAAGLAQHSSEALNHGARQLREQVRHAGAQARGLIADEPVKALLVALAAGAALTWLGSLLARGRHSGH